MTEQTVEQLQEELAAARKANRDLKQKVITTARKYAKEHQLCEVVDRAIEEAGLGPELIRVSLEMVIPTKIEASVDAMLLEGMSEEEKKRFLAENIAPALLTLVDYEKTSGLVPQPLAYGGNSANRNTLETKVTHGAITVEGIGEIEIPDPPPDPYDTPRGYLPRYTSDLGRIVHYFLDRPGGYATSLCGRSEVFRSSLSETSTKAENRVCGNCVRAASEMPR